MATDSAYNKPLEETLTELTVALITVRDEAGAFRQRSLTDACLRLNRIEEIARRALAANPWGRT